MAGWRENNGAQQTIKRLQDDLNIGKGTREALEAVMVGHAAEGRVGDFTTIMSAIGKTSSMASLEGKLDDLIKVVRSNGGAPVDVDKVASMDPLQILTSAVKDLSNSVDRSNKQVSWLTKKVKSLDKEEPTK